MASPCRGLRAIGVQSPILVLSTRNDIAERIATLDAGADAYMASPHETAEILARLRALLRRTQPPARLQAGDLTLDQERCIASRGPDEIPLSHREAELLALFIHTPGHLVTHHQALEQVWHNPLISPNVLNQYVSYLRRKLGQPPLISTPPRRRLQTQHQIAHEGINRWMRVRRANGSTASECSARCA
jgi:two-component system response regulator MprA